MACAFIESRERADAWAAGAKGPTIVVVELPSGMFFCASADAPPGGARRSLLSLVDIAERGAPEETERLRHEARSALAGRRRVYVTDAQPAEGPGR